MSAADQRCRLFSPEVAAALAAGAAQARGAALRAGADSANIRNVEATARARASQVDCRAPDLATAAARVRSAFAGYAHVSRLSYPGDIAGWRADRMVSRSTRWQLAQDARFGADAVTFGIAGRETPGVLLAVARFADGATPYAARLVLRDADRSAGPYLARWTTGATANLPLDRRLPNPAATKAYAAEARSPAGFDLLPKGAKAGWAFRFPVAAQHELAALDPREAVAIEFLFPGDVTRRAYVEVGDFAAGRAFLQVASR